MPYKPPENNDIQSAFQEPLYHMLARMEMYGANPPGVEGALLGYTVSLAVATGIPFHQAIASWMEERRRIHNGHSEYLLCEIPNRFVIHDLPVKPEKLNRAENMVFTAYSMIYLEFRSATCLSLPNIFSREKLRQIESIFCQTITDRNSLFPEIPAFTDSFLYSILYVLYSLFGVDMDLIYHEQREKVLNVFKSLHLKFDGARPFSAYDPRCFFPENPECKSLIKKQLQHGFIHIASEIIPELNISLNGLYGYIQAITK